MDLPRGDASQRERQGLGRRRDLHDSLVPWPWTPGGWEPLGVTVSRQGPPCSPTASPVWAPPWSLSQPSPLPTPSRPGTAHSQEKVTGPLHSRQADLAVPSGWVSSLTQVSWALSSSMPQLQTLLPAEASPPGHVSSSAHWALTPSRQPSHPLNLPWGPSGNRPMEEGTLVHKPIALTLKRGRS